MDPKDEVKEELSAEEIEAAAAQEETAKTEAAEEVKEKTFAEFGLNERYDGMSREELAGDIKSRNTSFGHQSEQLGQLRKELATTQEQIANFKKAADLPAEVKAEVKKLSDYELKLWLDELQSDPHAAMRNLLGDNFGRRSDEDLGKFVSDQINEALSGYHGYTEEQAAMADPDYQSAAGYIQYLQTEEHFGNTRPMMELLELWRLATTDKPSADAVYDTMKRFPGVPMKDCIHMVNGRPKSKVDPDKIRKQVKSLAGGGLPPGSSKVSSTEKIEDMDAAFDVEE